MEKMSLAEKIIIYRKRAGLKQYELAEKAGVSALTILNIENGHTEPQDSTLQVIATALNVPFTYLKGE